MVIVQWFFFDSHQWVGAVFACGYPSVLCGRPVVVVHRLTHIVHNLIQVGCLAFTIRLVTFGYSYRSDVYKLAYVPSNAANTHIALTR